ncbi:unnamed protein product [Macrosiphum euphorbiae]|uniref:DUF4218 domain-containing protein n=1 Tax=Macrosiphum euphorbiae TaxID=13131 RepID=A0AAV0Y8T7_9HEMI|nr:unnamed protein product [Macrosiphum euphorbiae]
MESRNSSRKKICLSKSQFNRNIKQQLDCLDHLRTQKSVDALPVVTPCLSFQSQSVGYLSQENNLLVEGNNISNTTTLDSSPKMVIKNSNYVSQTLSNTTQFIPKQSSELIENVINTDQANYQHNIPETLKLSVPDQLRQWAVRNKITHTALGELLLIQRQIPDFKNIPINPKTFLHTPRQTILRDVSPGQYYHFGLENSISSILKNIDSSNFPDVINVAINIDGLPLSKSSSSQVYPILCSVNNIDIILPVNICCVGIYHGYDKPSDFNEFLKEFVDEAVTLTSNGININDKHYGFKIVMFLFDAVAKASVLFIKGHSGYSSCSKCTLGGEYINSVCFTEIEFNKRTDSDFMNQTDPDHHTGHTILEKIPNIGLVTQVPLDYMHLICLGVVKKLLVSTWCFGPPPHKLPSRIIKVISESLTNLVPYIPVEFARKPRPLKYSKRFKATEFRQFILYTGVIVLKKKLENNKYKHFLSLHFAITVLLSDIHLQTMMNYAEELLKHFVICTKLIYGPQFMSHNFHNLLHLTDDARKFGNLNNFGNFSFENYLQKIKKMLRKHDGILPQLVRRLAEERSLQILPNHKVKPNNFKLEREHSDGILLNDTCNPQ